LNVRYYLPNDTFWHTRRPEFSESWLQLDSIGMIITNSVLQICILLFCVDSLNGGDDMFSGFWLEYLKERDIMKDQCIGGRIILK
jgi:hypothetical protein